MQDISSSGAVAPRMDTHALQVVCRPELCAQRPLLRRLAWIALMTARGKSVNQTRLAAMCGAGA